KPSTRAKWRSSECTAWCASKVLDSADIVRDACGHMWRPGVETVSLDPCEIYWGEREHPHWQPNWRPN
ncbi:MAG: hypothetical protein ACLPMG_05865, partial [Terriglobales bacterium]